MDAKELAAKDLAQQLGITVAKVKKISEALFGAVKIDFTEADIEAIKNAVNNACITEGAPTQSQSNSDGAGDLVALPTSLSPRQQQKVVKVLGMTYLQKRYAQMLLDTKRSFNKAEDAINTMTFQFEQRVYGDIGESLDRIGRNISAGTAAAFEVTDKHQNNLFSSEFVTDLEAILTLEE
jgi:hypothetical protein